MTALPTIPLLDLRGLRAKVANDGIAAFRHPSEQVREPALGLDPSPGCPDQGRDGAADASI